MKKILIIDDDNAILEVLEIILKDKGYNTITLSKSELIYKTLEENNPDLVLLDIWMSGIDGQEIARKLKKEEKTKSIPIVMISANNEGELLAKRSGADAFISKPFEIEDLLTIIEKTFQKSDESLQKT